MEKLQTQMDYFQSLIDIRDSFLEDSCFKIAIASGKGGVGKSNFALNLAIALAQKNKMLLLDGDPGLADLNIMMGINPSAHWGMFVEGSLDFKDIVERDIYGLDFIHGFSGVSSINWVQSDAMQRIIRSLHILGKEYGGMVIDVGAGLSEPTIAFTTTVDLVVLVLNKELTSLADAYGTLKTIRKWNPFQKVSVVVNSVEGTEDPIKVYENLCLVSEQFLGIKPEYLGHLPLDKAVPSSILRQKPVIELFPDSPYIQQVTSIAHAIGTCFN